MAKKKARVTDFNGNGWAQVVIDRGDACNHCEASQFCHSITNCSKMKTKALNKADATVGDLVAIEMNSKTLYKIRTNPLIFRNWRKPMQPKKSILIVDDDIAHRTMLRILLNWNYEIFEADDGSVAIEKILDDSFDLIIMDVRMPNVSGLEALDAIKTLRPETPVVMMTAYGSDQIADEARKKGAFDYLPKPFDFDQLRQTIERAVAR